MNVRENTTLLKTADYHNYFSCFIRIINYNKKKKESSFKRSLKQVR